MARLARALNRSPAKVPATVTAPRRQLHAGDPRAKVQAGAAGDDRIREPAHQRAVAALRSRLGAPSEPPPHSSMMDFALTRRGSAASKPWTIMRA